MESTSKKNANYHRFNSVFIHDYIIILYIALMQTKRLTANELNQLHSKNHKHHWERVSREVTIRKNGMKKTNDVWLGTMFVFHIYLYTMKMHQIHCNWLQTKHIYTSIDGKLKFFMHSMNEVSHSKMKSVKDVFQLMQCIQWLRLLECDV